MHIDVKTAAEALEYKNQVVEAGLVQGVDFYWRFTPSQDNWEMAEYISASVEIVFMDSSNETYFQLKWAK